MRIDIISIFPKMFSAVLDESIIKRAQAKGKVRIFTHDFMVEVSTSYQRRF